jgi:hypothetical protein
MRFYFDHTSYADFLDYESGYEAQYKGWYDRQEVSETAKGRALHHWVARRFATNADAAAAPELPASLRGAAMSVDRRFVEDPFTDYYNCEGHLGDCNDWGRGTYW